MTTNIKGNVLSLLVVALSLFSNYLSAGNNSIGLISGHVHFHNGERGSFGHERGRYYSRRGYYDRGGYSYGSGWGAWGVPNIIINVPRERYYGPECEKREVCNSYGQCWLEQYCD